MMQTSGASVSAAPYTIDPITSRASPSITPLAQPNRKHRYSSRSNSISGSSVSTVQRVASRSSSQNGAHIYGVRPQSPGESGHKRQFSHSRRKSVAVDSADVDRWSQSTDSSAGSKRHQRMSSGVMLGSALTHQIPPPRRTAVDQSPRSQPGSRQRPASPFEYVERTRKPQYSRPSSRGNPLNSLPSLQTNTYNGGFDSDTPSTASGGLPTAIEQSHASFAPEYFVSKNASPRSVAQQRPSTARSAAPPSASLNYSRMPRAEDVKESAHIRRKSEHLSNMEKTMPTVSIDDKKERGPKVKDKAEREKKAMLSKALEKANTAVILDNRQNFMAALDCYTDACTLLQQVMDRSVNSADRRKLEAIKVTYSDRITELKMLENLRKPVNLDKHLPMPPTANQDSPDTPDQSEQVEEQEELARTQAAIKQRLTDVPRLSYDDKDRDSFFSRTMADVERAAGMQNDTNHGVPETPRTPAKEHVHIVNQRVSKLPPPEETKYIPAPLTTKKVPSPTSPAKEEQFVNHIPQPEQAPPAIPTQDENNNSWLDTIDESASDTSSVHSTSGTMHRKNIQTHDDVGADLDAAFDAAVEAAYDEGLEPDLDSKLAAPLPSPSHRTDPSSVQSPSSVKEMDETAGETATHGGAAAEDSLDDTDHDLDDDDDAEEDERILDEFTQDYGHGFNFAFGTKSALPRQSDSSGYSRSTWQSSQASERTTAGTSLSTVAENDSYRQSRLSKPPIPALTSVSMLNLESLPPSAPPPLTALPPTPPPAVPGSANTVRGRRISNANGDLKIETSSDREIRKRPMTSERRPSAPQVFSLTGDTHKEVNIGAPLEPTDSDRAHERMLKSPPSLDLLSANTIVNTGLKTPTDSLKSEDNTGLLQMRPTLTRKNMSSLSLRADHTILLPSPGIHELGDTTPLSATFTVNRSKLHLDPLASQRVALPTFAPSMVASSLTGGMYLFDTVISTARDNTSPTSPSDIPVGLEPCPQSLLLRPFWLMRCLASTITHPRGGFLTTKLFVPREAWQTRGVKLKCIEDKVANCDLLTAALGQLAKVDTLDADLVMDELQRFEEVMERVQTALVKKLGGEVGVHGVNMMFKDAPPATSTATSTFNEKAADTFSGGVTDKNSKSHSGKGYLSSWRKLRSKSSGAPVAGSTSVITRNNAAEKDARGMSTVPMTNFIPVERRGQRKDARNMNFDGPNREYMSSLARLFQGVQVLDQIARQVEDPGLKHSSQTHVGLELSIRHAAEFFCFYICRFVLADIGVLVDKFIKRGTEWVMA